MELYFLELVHCVNGVSAVLIWCNASAVLSLNVV